MTSERSEKSFHPHDGEEALSIFARTRAVITDSHVVYASGKHGHSYINKDAVYPHTEDASQLCLGMARSAAERMPDAVIAPAIGGAILSLWTAHHLTSKFGREVPSLVAQKMHSSGTFVLRRGYDKLIKGKKVLAFDHSSGGGAMTQLAETNGGTVVDGAIFTWEECLSFLSRSSRTASFSESCRAIAERYKESGADVVLAPTMWGVALSQFVAHHLMWITGKDVLAFYAEPETAGKEFSVEPEYIPLIDGRRILVVEDVLTTGGSARKIVELVRDHGGLVVGLCALCNRGGVTAEGLADVPWLHALANVSLDSWDPPCPLCVQGIPINTEVGKGAEYLARQGM